jgi:hypothetical protein
MTKGATKITIKRIAPRALLQISSEGEVILFIERVGTWRIRTRCKDPVDEEELWLTDILPTPFLVSEGVYLGDQGVRVVVIVIVDGD